MSDVYDLADKYADSIIHSVDFQNLLSLNKEIKLQLKNKIIAFKTAESKYLDAKQYGNYHPNFAEYQERFSKTKKALYEEPLVKKYKKLEFEIQKKLDNDINDLKKCISNKFKLTKKLM